LDESLRLDVGSMTPFLSDFLPRSVATKQSILSFRGAMDCFASLAMTSLHGHAWGTEQHL
jgi:hypothetical protein